MSPANDELVRMRNQVGIEKGYVSNVSAMDYPGTFPGIDDAWDFDTFKKNFSINITKMQDDELEFDLIGVDASLANAFRRIMHAEVPTMCIEKVYILNQTSVMNDFVLAHRLGLIPLKIDPREFQYKEPEDDATDLNTVVFRLNVHCKAPKNPAKDADPYHRMSVYSSHLTWEPQGDQAERFQNLRPAHENILLMRLRAGQVIELEAHCHKGIGKDHAKFSPVSAIGYRLMPVIDILEPITGDLAYKFQRCFPKGVIDVVENKKGIKEAIVKDARKDTVTREVLRYPELAEKVRLARVRNHFIFNVESVGSLPSKVIFEESIKILSEKCRLVLESLQDLN